MLAGHHTGLRSLSIIVLAGWFASGALVACSTSDGETAAADDGVTTQADTVSDTALEEDTGGQADVTPDVVGPVGTCEGQADGTVCEDGNVCTTEDTCLGGLCVGGVNVVCDAQGACSQGSCESASGCVYEALADGTACDVTCFGSAACQAGQCVVDLDTAVLCPEPEGVCLEQLGCDPGTGECTVEIYTPMGVDCDTDEDLCSQETCDGLGACVSTGETENCASENDENPCWTYVCNAKSGCVQTNFVEGVSCNDFNDCTYSDTCTYNEFQQETCVGEAIPTDDQNPCTDDACADGTVTHTPVDGASCVSGDGCALPGTCDGGQCVVDDQEDCDCTTDSECTQPTNLCDGAIVCTAGQCVLDLETVVSCEAPTDMAACQALTCEPSTGECGTSWLDNGTSCVPGNPICGDTGTCQEGLCVADEACGCAVDSDCTPPEDLCTGVMVCNVDWGEGEGEGEGAESPSGTCVLDTDQAVVCPAGPTPCEGSVCSPDTGQCNPVSFANDTPCTPSGTSCGDIGTCQMGQCEPAGECPTQEAVYLFDGLESVVLRTFDEGDTWEQVSTVPAPPPSLATFTRGADAVLYVGIYFNTTDAANAGYPEGNQIFRSQDAGVTWEHMGSWNAGSSASALCAGKTATHLLYATDTAGGIIRSEDGGMNLNTVGSWGVQGSMVDCVVAPSGLVMFADAAYCGEPAEDGCAAVWTSADLGVTATVQGNYTPEGMGNKAAIDVDLNGTFWAVSGDHDIYRSEDDGQSWALAGSVPSLKGIGDIVAADNGALYAGTPTSACVGDCDPATSGGEFYVSKDGGQTWGKSASQWTPGGNGSGWMALVTAHVSVP